MSLQYTNLTQEQVDELSNEIVKINRQIELLESPDFEDTLPSVKQALQELKAYREQEQGIIDQWNQRSNAQTEAAPAEVGPIDYNALAQNPTVKKFFDALLKTMSAANVQQEQARPQAPVGGLLNEEI